MKIFQARGAEPASIKRVCQPAQRTPHETLLGGFRSRRIRNGFVVFGRNDSFGHLPVDLIATFWTVFFQPNAVGPVSDPLLPI
jgi:hypothetical protein